MKLKKLLGVINLTVTPGRKGQGCRPGGTDGHWWRRSPEAAEVEEPVGEEAEETRERSSGNQHPQAQEEPGRPEKEILGQENWEGQYPKIQEELNSKSSGAPSNLREDKGPMDLAFL